MRGFRFTVAAVVALATAAVTAAIAVAPAGATTGLLVITADTTLTDDHYGQVSIGADNVTLDCAGHRIVGTTSMYGVANWGHPGVTVKNCVQSGARVGFMLWDGHGDRFLNDSASGNAINGFRFERTSTGNAVMNSTATGNAWAGFALSDGAADNALTGNTSIDNNDGFQVSNDAHDNVLTGNTATANRHDGFHFDRGPWNNTLAGNAVRDNGMDGFGLYSVSGNHVIHNLVAGNHRGGILLFGSAGAPATDNVFEDNTVEGNAYEAIGLLEGASGNTLVGNVVVGNGLTTHWGAVVVAGHSNGNVLTGNRADGNGSAGFEIRNSTQAALSANTAKGNVTGFVVYDGSSETSLTNNVAVANRIQGFALWDAHDTTFAGNTAIQNGDGGLDGAGFLINDDTTVADDGNVLRGNTANLNNGAGFLTKGIGGVVSGNRFENNTANNNTWFGFGAWKATGNTWTHNTANHNGHWGFALFGGPSSGNEIRGNTARNNGDFDLHDENPPNANTWLENNARTSAFATENLVVNGGAEAAPGGDDSTVVSAPGWTTTGSLTVVDYALAEATYGVGEILGPSSPGPADRGLNFFSGGPPDGPTSTATQTIDLSGYSALISAGASFSLRGWLGGYDGQDDNATLTVTFKGSGGATLGSTTIGPVLASDRPGTSLVYREGSGHVPTGTRSAVVQLVMTRSGGAYNDGYADNLSLLLVPGVW